MVPVLSLTPSATAAEAARVADLPINVQSDGTEGGLVGSSAVFYGGATYVFGGRLADGAYSTKVWKYDHATNEVAVDAVAEFPSGRGRQSGAAVAIGSKIYYFGGAVLVQVDLNSDGQPETVPQASSEIFEFDPATSRLRQLTGQALPTGAWGLGAATFGSKAYIFGGFSFDISRPSDIARRDWILRYDPASTTRPVERLDATLHFPVQDMGVAAVGNRIFLFGGLSDNDNVTNPCPTTRQYNAQTDTYEERPLSVCTTDRIMSFDPGAEIMLGYEQTLPQRTQFLTVGTVRSKAYLAGGRLPDGTASASIIEFSPSASPPLRTLVPTLPRGVFGAPVSVDAGGALFMFGGRFGGVADLTDDVVKITPGPTRPFPPRSLATSQITGGVRLVWEPPAYDGDAPILSYRIFRTESGKTEERIAEKNALTYDDLTARPGAEYAYRVTAVNSAGESEGATTSRATDAAVPGAVRDLAAYGGNGEVLLRWSAPADNGGSAITGYRIYRDDLLLTVRPPTPTEYRDADVVNGERYSYVVRAVNVKGEGAAVPARSATPAEVPEAPSGLQAVSDGEGVRLEWLAPTQPTDRFVIYRGVLPGALTEVASTQGTDHFDVSVSRGNTYYYAITAANSVGESPPSQIQSVSLVTRPGAPQNLFAAPREGAIHLTWQAPDDTGEADASALRYYVSRKDPGATQFRILDTGDLATTSYTDTEVLPGREYVYTVTTLNPLASSASAEVRGVPLAVPNVAPIAYLELDAEAAEVREQVRFDATKSSDTDGRIAAYLFEFDDGTPLLNSTDSTATHAYATDGYYTVSLRVVDEDGAISEPVSRTLKVGKPPERPDDNSAPKPPATTTQPPGASTGKIPGPGSALVALAAVGASLVLRRRR